MADRTPQSESTHTIYRWLLWAVLVLPYMVAHFHRLSIGVLRSSLMAEFGLSATGFAQIGAAYFYVYAVLQVPSGILADGLGPRWTITASALITALGTLLFALAPNSTFLFVSRLVIGVGVSAIFIGILKVLSLWFHEREFATLTGLTVAVGTLGAIGAQTPLYSASVQWGWRTPFLFVAGFTSITALICFLLVRDHPSAGQPRTRAYGLKAQVVRILTNRRTWPPWLIFTGVYGAFISFVGTWGQGYLLAVYGVPEAVGADILSVAVLAFAVGGLGISILSDRIRRRRSPMVVGSSLCLLFWMLLLSGIPVPLWGIWICVVAMGAFSGVVLITLPAGKEVNDPAYSGTSTSVVNVGGFLGSAIFPVLMGLVLDLLQPGLHISGAYRYALLVCIGGVVLGLIGALLTTETRCRNICETTS
ncbi:MAG: MFS transporter [Spirochaetaceae bacterium]|nr:MAG: MFS transporter [Spirochaetaceae bacterium]